MPLYEYECTTCHRRTEKIQKFSDAELTICPHCGGPLERTITAPAFQFAGGGWYKDGYGNAKPAESSGKSEGGGSEGGKDSGSQDSGSKNSGGGDSSGDSATLKPAADSGGGAKTDSKPAAPATPAPTTPKP